MGYRHIDNLYKDQRILLFRECFALEKIHGTSAHVSWTEAEGVRFSSGGEKHERFVKLFDEAALRTAFMGLGHPTVIVYGEAYGQPAGPEVAVWGGPPVHRLRGGDRRCVAGRAERA